MILSLDFAEQCRCEVESSHDFLLMIISSYAAAARLSVLTKLPKIWTFVNTYILLCISRTHFVHSYSETEMSAFVWQSVKYKQENKKNKAESRRNGSRRRHSCAICPARS